MRQDVNREEVLFETARQLGDAEARAAFLTQACPGDEDLRRRVEGLLSAQPEAEELFRSLAPAPSARSRPGVTDEEVGTIIGRYTLLELIAEGGMGVVYRAEQREPVRRQVALKIIKPGMDTRQVVARFEAERQTLALMDHPNIAKVLDGGMTAEGKSEVRDPKSETSPKSEPRNPTCETSPKSEVRSPKSEPPPPSSDFRPPTSVLRPPSSDIPAGRPYFVMELVEGVPITEFCVRHGLSLEQRLRLFIPVCQAVQHAHQKGIIHRDLKPSNVLVTLQDGTPVPKVIDFGVAKALHQRLTEKTVFTQHATLIGTPAYMSPEQAELSGLDVDTRSDIYSLGVLLYELLTGTQPFAEQRLRSVAYAELQQILLHEEPERPSTRMRKTVEAADARSQAPSRDWIAQLRGDLDWIVLQCLEKDRNRRYETANGLAADLRRFLGNEPVVARPPTAFYRLQKAVRRNRLAFAAAAAVAVALLAGIAGTAWQARRARQEQVRAEHRLHATVQLLGKTFTNVMPALRMTIGATKPREELALAASEIADELLQDTQPGPEVSWILGELYLQLAMVQGYQYGAATTGEYAEALESALKAARFFGLTGLRGLSEERVGRLIWAEMCAGFALQGLLRFDDALAHFDQMRQ